MKKKHQKKPNHNEKYLTPGYKSLRFKNHYFLIKQKEGENNNNNVLT